MEGHHGKGLMEGQDRSAIGHASIVPSGLGGFDVLVTGPDGKTVKRFHAETEAAARATVAEEYPTVRE